MYNSGTSRWTSPDSHSGHAYDPQSLNKYGYNRNDPMNKVDANGKDWITDFIMANYAWLLAISSPGNSEGAPVNPFDVPLLADLMEYVGMDPSLAYQLAYGGYGYGGGSGGGGGGGGGGGSGTPDPNCVQTAIQTAAPPRGLISAALQKSKSKSKVRQAKMERFITRQSSTFLAILMMCRT